MSTVLVGSGRGAIFEVDKSRFALPSAPIAGNMFDARSHDAANGKDARFRSPLGITLHNNYVYVGDYFDHKIVAMATDAPHGVTTVGGKTGFQTCVDGPLGTSRTSFPHGIYSVETHPVVYFIDHCTRQGRMAVRKLSQDGASSSSSPLLNLMGTVKNYYGIDWDTANVIKYFDPVCADDSTDLVLLKSNTHPVVFHNEQNVDNPTTVSVTGEGRLWAQFAVYYTAAEILARRSSSSNVGNGAASPHPVIYGFKHLSNVLFAMKLKVKNSTANCRGSTPVPNLVPPPPPPPPQNANEQPQSKEEETNEVKTLVVVIAVLAAVLVVFVISIGVYCVCAKSSKAPPAAVPVATTGTGPVVGAVVVAQPVLSQPAGYNGEQQTATQHPYGNASYAAVVKKAQPLC